MVPLPFHKTRSANQPAKVKHLKNEEYDARQVNWAAGVCVFCSPPYEAFSDMGLFALIYFVAFDLN